MIDFAIQHLIIINLPVNRRGAVQLFDSISFVIMRIVIVIEYIRSERMKLRIRDINTIYLLVASTIVVLFLSVVGAISEPENVEVEESTEPVISSTSEDAKITESSEIDVMSPNKLIVETEPSDEEYVFEVGVLRLVGSIELPETESETESETEETEYIRYNLNEEEKIMLQKIAWAEAGSTGVEGMAMIMQVVMNRVDDPRFPDNVHDVICAPGQFTPMYDGSYNSAQVNASTQAALDLMLSGNDLSQGALYFCTPSAYASGNWHRSLKLLYQYKNMMFFCYY